MSAIQSLLRVMTLRDAEAIILEADKVPSLRRRGQIEKLAMPALDRQLLADFTGPLLAGRSLDDGPASVAFHEPGGAHYQVTMEKLATGLRVVVRPGKPPAAPAPAAPPRRPPRPPPPPPLPIHPHHPRRGPPPGGHNRPPGEQRPRRSYRGQM